MSSFYVKTKYNEEGNWGSIEEKTLYCHHHNTCDYVNFYDENGTWIMTIPDTISNNLLDAINRLYSPYKDNSCREYEDGIEQMTNEDREKCK